MDKLLTKMEQRNRGAEQSEPKNFESYLKTMKPNQLAQLAIKQFGLEIRDIQSPGQIRQVIMDKYTAVKRKKVANE